MGRVTKISTLFVCMNLAAVSSFAYSQAGKAEKPRAANRMLEEVVVTAQKREESMQDVPISIQAFSGEKLDAMGIDEPKALQLVTPGLQYNTFAGYSLIYIRGVGTDAFIPSADASVATYIDNIYYPFGHSLASALGSIERIEVLKGPQGTLFGRNSTGGAINIVTKKPSPEAWYANVTVEEGRHDKQNYRLFANMPVTDTIAISASWLGYRQEQYYDLGEKSPRTFMRDETSDGYNVKVAWMPGDLSVELGVSNIATSGEQSMWLPNQRVSPLGAALGATASADYVLEQDAPNYIDSEAKVLTADIQYATPWFDTRLILGDQDIFSPALADYDGSAQPLVTFESIGQFADVQTGELQILSNENSWGGSWLEWILGAYYIDSSAGYDPLVFAVSPNAISYLANPPVTGPLEGLGAATQPMFAGITQAAAAAGIDPLGAFNNGINLALEGVLGTKSTAYFFQATADLGAAFALTLGGRYQTETRTLLKSRTSYVEDPDDYRNGSTLFDFGSREAETENFSPKVSLDYKFSDDDMLYASFSQGYKSGTFNIIAIYTPTQYVEPEKTTAYEIGYKGTLLDGNLQFNAAAFQNVIDNLQVQTISLTSGGAVRFETAGSAKIDGGEFDITWLALPELVPGLVATMSASYLNGVYTSYEEGSGYDEQSGIFFDGTVQPTRDFSGNELVRTPQWSGNIGLNYSTDIGPGNLEVAADAYYNSGFHFSAQNTETTVEEEYYVTNARISYLIYDWSLRLTAYGKNLNNGRYHYTMQELDFGTASLLAPYASYGLRMNWDYEF